MARGTKLWQAAGSPIIQGRSRSERPFWQQAAAGVALAALLGAVADAVLSPPYALSWAEAGAFAGALLVGAQIGFLPVLLVAWVGRAAGWSRVSVVAGILGGAVAAFYLLGGWHLF